MLQVGVAPGLDFMSSGGQVGFTLGLIHIQRLTEMITTLPSRYDRILLDSPPMIGVSDASVLATAMDGALLLIQHRRNPQAMTLRAQQTLKSARTPIVGAILNQIPADAGEEYGYYTHNYAYYGSDHRGKAKPSVRADAWEKGKQNKERLDLNEPDA